MDGMPSVTIERREIAETEARLELLSMEEDPTTRAERHVRQQHTEKTVVVLQEEIRTLKSENEKLEKRLRLRSTTLTRKLDRNTFWTKVCAALVLIAIVGPTDKVLAAISMFLEYMSRKMPTRPGG